MVSSIVESKRSLIRDIETLNTTILCVETILASQFNGTAFRRLQFCIIRYYNDYCKKKNCDIEGL